MLLRTSRKGYSLMRSAKLIKPAPLIGKLNLIKNPSVLFSNETKSNNIEPSSTLKSQSKSPKIAITEQHGDPIINKSFKTETKEILDIVSRSIYTNKEIFLRELISNASDAIEQLRYLMNKSPNKFDQKISFRIDVITDPENNRIIIRDNGLGMNKTELVENLGVIAKSGSKNFLKSLQKSGQSSSSIIGQFGVGFYSSFMVSSKVEVFTKSSLDKSSPAFYWVSDGKGSFSISNAEKVERGTKIIINLNKDSADFSKNYNIERIIMRYSNFVEQPIYLNNKKVNLQGAIWLKDPKSVSAVQHAEFFKHLTNAYDKPMHHLHFHKDYPLSLHALLYIPKYHSEKYGNARMKPGVNLYSRKVLIQKESPDILPDWMRFVKGVVDSEDLTLNISRDSTQSSSTLKRIKSILLRSLVTELKSLCKRSKERYDQFYEEYNVFLKEGTCTDVDYKNLIAPLLRFDSSLCESAETAGKDKNPKNTPMRSLDDYIGSAKNQQKNIYYLVTTNRTAALNSPYYESFRKSNTEVLFLYTPLDEFVMQAIGVYEKRNLVSIESNKVNQEDIDVFKEKRTEFELSKSQTEDLCDWLAEVLKSRVKGVKPTARLDSSPALVTGHENASVQVMMQLTNSGRAHNALPQHLEINPAHKVIRGLFYTMRDEEALAKKVATQIFENALIDAGLLKDPRGMLGRMNDLMAAAMDVDGIELELRQEIKRRNHKTKPDKTKLNSKKYLKMAFPT